MDLQNMFWDNVAITASALSSVIDMGNISAVDVNGNPVLADSGQAPLFIECRVGTTFLTCTSVQIQVEQSANSDGSSGTVLLQTAAIAVASLIAGYKFALGSLPAGMTQRYLVLNAVVAGSNATAGKLTAYLTGTPHGV